MNLDIEKPSSHINDRRFNSYNNNNIARKKRKSLQIKKLNINVIVLSYDQKERKITQKEGEESRIINRNLNYEKNAYETVKKIIIQDCFWMKKK